jgi:hypothetical protein
MSTLWSRNKTVKKTSGSGRPNKKPGGTYQSTKGHQRLSCDPSHVRERQHVEDFGQSSRRPAALTRTRWTWQHRSSFLAISTRLIRRKKNLAHLRDTYFTLPKKSVQESTGGRSRLRRMMSAPGSLLMSCHNEQAQSELLSKILWTNKTLIKSTDNFETKWKALAPENLRKSSRPKTSRVSTEVRELESLSQALRAAGWRLKNTRCGESQTRWSARGTIPQLVDGTVPLVKCLTVELLRPRWRLRTLTKRKHLVSLLVDKCQGMAGLNLHCLLEHLLRKIENKWTKELVSSN